MAAVFARTKLLGQLVRQGFPRGNNKYLIGSGKWSQRLSVRAVSTASEKEESSVNYTIIGLVCGAATAISLLSFNHKNQQARDAKKSLEHNSSVAVETVKPGASPSLPIYTRDEVAKHNTKEHGIWVTYHGRVYDITEFIESHPGGPSKISLAAGGALEPFWSMYAVHWTKEVQEILEEYRIGDLTPEDQHQSLDVQDPYTNDPERHPALKVNTKKPFNGEVPIALLGDNFVTPKELFFVRNHLPVPDIDASKFQLEVGADGKGNTLKLSLHDLKTKFKKYTIATTLMCAGNRRSEMNEIKKVKGLNWGSGAVSTARWSGARLRDVLEHAGLDERKLETMGVRHVQFVGKDADSTGSPYGASIQVEKAMSPMGDVLLAYEMNGNDIPRDHGYPVRAVVPGVVGARNVKWVNKIVVSQDESPCHWQQNDYKGFNPTVDWDTVDFTSALAIQDLPVTSSITEPANGTSVSADEEEITVKGYAWSGGGRGIVRVDVSTDGGKTWPYVASLSGEKQKLNREWAWTLWEATVKVPKDCEKLEVCCKAVDNSYNTQPDTVAPIWNLRGVLSNAWHRVHVNVTATE